jgi:alanine-synthesizing transaminase
MFSKRFRWNLETNRLAHLLAEKRAAGAALLDLTESNPTRAGLDYPTDEILKALPNPAAMSYEPTPRGIIETRRSVADYYQQRGYHVPLDRLHLTASTSEGYAFLFKLLCDDGDVALVPQPSYPLFDFLAALEGVTLRPYHLDYVHPRGWRIDFDSLHSAIDERTRAVIVVNPNNPTGSFLSPDERAKLLEICTARRLALIVDEVFGDYAWNKESGIDGSLVNAGGEALVFVLSGLSKIVALPQMKLAWIVTSGPEQLANEAVEHIDLIADTYLSVSTPIQRAAIDWLQLREGIQAGLLDRVGRNLGYLTRAIEGTSGRLLKAQGGWYATIEVPRHESEEELVLSLLRDDNVIVHPGYFFDFPREAYLILSLLTPEAVFSEATARVIARTR